MRSIKSFLLAIALCTLWPGMVRAQLFSLQTRQTAGWQRFAMEFLDRYFVDLLLRQDVSAERKMADDKVYFRQGGISDLRKLNDSIPYSIVMRDRYYDVKWLHDTIPFVNIVFPIQYDLLLGMDQEEAQQKLENTIMEAPPRTIPQKPSNLKGSLQTLNENISMLKTDTFLMASLHDGTYYYKGKGKPVFDTAHPEYSAANLFIGLVDDGDRQLQVEQSVYGLKTVSYTLPLRQWLNYCSEWGLKIYFAVEEKREDGLLALIIAQSKELGFNHMLSILLPNKFVTDKDITLKTRLTPYIPMHNVKDLFKQESPNRKKIKWQ